MNISSHFCKNYPFINKNILNMQENPYKNAKYLKTS